MTVAPTRARTGRVERWVVAELVRLDGQHPGVARLLRSTWRRPGPVLVSSAAVLGSVFGLMSPRTDQTEFIDAGVRMIGPGFFDVLADPWLQVGPLYLAVLGLAARLLMLVGLPLEAVGVLLTAGLTAVAIWLALMVTGRAARVTGADARRAQWAVGGALVVGGYLADAVLTGHPEEVMVGLLVAAGALAAGGQRPVVAGVLVALATGVKQWGPIGGGVLVAGRRLRGAAVAVAVYVVAVAVQYVPFAVLGRMNTFEWHWAFGSDSLLVHVAGGLDLADWWMRVIQGGAAGLVGLVLALRRRGSVLVAVIGLLSARLLLDPMRSTYYWAPLVAVLLVWMWTSPSVPLRHVRGTATLILPLLVVSPYVVPTTVFWRLGDVVTIALPLLCLWFDRASGGPAPTDPVRREHTEDLVSA